MRKDSVHFDRAPAFLEAISPARSDVLGHHLVGSGKRWIFRGQANADWRLEPSAFRLDPPARFLTMVHGWQTLDGYRHAQVAQGFGQEVAAEQAQAEVELQTLINFFVAADEAGLTLPDDSQEIRSLLLLRYEHYIPWILDWPPTQLLSIMALAQHHGLSTRLLDWTWDSQAAAYFAAKEALKKGSSHFAVWALDAALVGWGTGLPGLPPGDSGRFQLELVTAPGATNSRLRAQQGLFTLLKATEKARDKEGKGIERTPLDDAIQELPQLIDLNKFVLPTSQAKDTLRLLSLEGVSAARLYPGYDGVVGGLKERPLWDGEEEEP
jgi:FRG domain